MNKEELKKRALSLVTIQWNYQLTIEEYGDDEAFFIWTNEEQDEGVTINLDYHGNLTKLSIDKDEEFLDGKQLELEERRRRADQFLLQHYPDALEHLCFSKSEKLTESYRYNYEQLVMGLPLEHAGCYIDVNNAGEIINFTYYGKKKIPEIPKELISIEKLIEDVKNKLDSQLVVTSVFSFLHDVKEDGYRLVYEMEPSFMKFNANAQEPSLSIIHDEGDPQVYETLPLLQENQQNDKTIEEIVGITENMEVLREVDMGEETGIVWRNRDWKMEEKDLSLDSFWRNRTEDTAKAMISKKTGKLRSFIWFAERDGDLDLTREDCYQIAVGFLQNVVPELYQYVKLNKRDAEDEEDDRSKESFIFSMFIGEIPVQSEVLIVTVNTNTGLIDHYSGPSIESEQLKELPKEPVLTKEEANEVFFNHLDFELAWKKDYEKEVDEYHLVYQACDKYTKTSIRYIDAITGEVITSKHRD
ncbi:YcdB/YcdC domain-containing protein [Fredinandcohnia sp. 179-A 10B2 NHS]|uniref:YcdB/YcdC domain-containing protein n=1 Tax=Fredinandcohnia sp. 179-A 10B2 NHS TaxID=3235176 RepID=UPI0039A0C8F3